MKRQIYVFSAALLVGLALLAGVVGLLLTSAALWGLLRRLGHPLTGRALFLSAVLGLLPGFGLLLVALFKECRRLRRENELLERLLVVQHN
jgi:hypothetical protein